MSQFFEQALAAKLASIPELTAIVGTAIYKTAIPQTHVLENDGPALTYTIPDKPFGHVLAGSDRIATATVQLDSWCLDTPNGQGASTVKQMAEAIRNGIDGPPGTWGNGTCVISWVLLQGDSDADEEPKAGSSAWLRRVMSNYRIQYRVSLPTGS